MLRTTFYQQSLLDVDPDEIRLAPHAVERRLPEVVRALVSPDDFREFYADNEGTGSCCPLVLTAMLLLQFCYNLSDEQLVGRCHRDLGFRYALGLQLGQSAPSVSSLRRFRRKLLELKGEGFLLQASLRLAVDKDLIPDTDLQTVDSTHTNCRGAVIDTYNLVAAGIQQVIRRVAPVMGMRATDLARQWGYEGYMARSIKGQVSIDWSDEQARNRLLTEEIRDADRLVEQLSQCDVALPVEVEEAVALLCKVARQDIEELPDGTFRIKRGTAKDRTISISDPEARHGHKSSHQLINGFKTNVMGTIASQFVTGIKVTDAGRHDSEPTGELIDQAEQNEVKPKEIVGDAAYSVGANVRNCSAKGVQILTKIGAVSHKSSIPKRDFTIDLDQMQVRCPGGQSTQRYTMVKDPMGSEERVACFHFDRVACRMCELRHRCCSRTAKGLNRQLKLSAYEREQQTSKAFNETPRAKEVLRSRSAVERLISHLVRMGMRQARFFGMHMVQFQAYMVAAAYNVKRYITLIWKGRRRAPG